MELCTRQPSQDPEEQQFTVEGTEANETALNEQMQRHEYTNPTFSIAEERLSETVTSGTGPIASRDMDVDSDGGSDNENMEGEDMDDVPDGFIGDFEEIDEDEEVQRFISLNLTPAASTHQSPTALRPQTDNQAMPEARAEESSEDEDDSFESITERESGRLASVPIEAETADAHPMVVSSSVAPKTTPDNGLFSKVSIAHMRRLRTLQDGFREKHVPKLADELLFFNPDVYRRYTVLAKPAERVAEVVVAAAAAPTSSEPQAPPTAPELLAPPPTQQKRSSLRTGGDIPASSVEQSSAAVNGTAATATRVTEVDNSAVGDGEPMAVDLPVSARTRHATSSLEEDDVVGAILGVMSSPKSRASNTQMQTSSTPTPVAPKAAAVSAIPQDIPNDMLVAMMAIEGVNNVEVASKLNTARNNTESAPNKDIATRLPKGYGGPFSQLTTAEHRQFLELAQRMKTGTALGAKENTDYQRLKPKVESEQQAFRLQAREKAIPLLRNISESVNETALSELAGIGAEALKSYPPAYMPVRVTAIRASSAGYVPLVYKDTLLQRGACYHAEMPAINEKAGVPVLGEGKSGEQRSLVMSRDPVAMDLAGRTGADVALSASALIALLTLPQSYNHEVIIPFRVVESAGAQESDPSDSAGKDAPPRRMVVVDKPLMPSHAATPRKLNQMHYEMAVRKQLVNRSRPLELAGGSLAKAPGMAIQAAEQSGSEDAGQDNANYTLWEFGDLRVLIRYSVHGFAPKETPSTATTTVTLETKLEYQLGSNSAEAAMASAGGGGDAYEDVSESERLAWWLGSYIRGSPSEVWVAHVDVHRSAITRMSRRTCGDLYSGDSAGGQPSTRGVLGVLQDLLRLNAGQYMLVHRRRTWDATIYRALDESEAQAPPQRASEAVMSLAAELKPTLVPDLTQLGVEGDYVQAAWAGVPAQIPYTYAPADLSAFVNSSQSKWKPKGAAAAISPTAARKRRRAAAKLNKKA
ncbi:hypothetical protein GGH93_006330 [Coemansia aciculifera]|nr:hypothetical protein GGH93_006330 [Coemansia aciculifera]